MAVPESEQAQPQRKLPVDEECTACKLWAQASSAFRKQPTGKVAVSEIITSSEGAVESVEPHDAALKSGIHAVPGHDCMACRVSGTVVSLGCSAFLTRQLYKPPPPVGAHRVAIMAFAGGFAVMGAIRAVI